VRRGVRAGGVAAATFVAGGALVLCLALLVDFGSAVGLSALAAPTWADGLGLTIVGAAYVPSAVVAAVGYVAGVGFEVGPATFSPLGSTSAELPAIPLLAAVPQASGPTVLSLSVLAIPLFAGALAGRVLARGEIRLAGRARAACVAAAFAGASIGLLGYVASGGVGNGRWSNFGTPPLLLAGIVTAEVLVIALAMVLLTAARRPRSAATGQHMGTGPASAQHAGTEPATARHAGAEPAAQPPVVNNDAPDERAGHFGPADGAGANDGSAGTVDERSTAGDRVASAESSDPTADDEKRVDATIGAEPVPSADPPASVDPHSENEPVADGRSADE
jgi:hypothetical protein